MSPAPRPFVFLPEVVLLEILGYLLVDTPCKPNRAAIFRTCSTLHELGLSLLYRVVDLRGHRTVAATLVSWNALFGREGVLTGRGTRQGLEARVRELRLGGQRQLEYSIALATFCFHDVRLPNCSTLVVDRAYLPLRGHSDTLPLSLFLADLPVVDLIAVMRPGHASPRGFGSITTAVPLSKQPWTALRTVCMQDALWLFREAESIRLGFAEWSFEVLAIDVTDLAAPDDSALYQVFFDPVNRSKSDRWWGALRRIELGTSSVVEDEFRRRLHKAQKRGSLARLQQRILPMVVFVDEDGTETKLIENEESV